MFPVLRGTTVIICHSHLWEGALKELRRKYFSLDNKVSVEFTDDSGTSESVIDLGRPKRELFYHGSGLDWTEVIL